MYFGKASSDYQITCIVLRPFVVTNGLEELFLNNFRINSFNILQRRYKKLEPYELNYLAKLEGVEEDSFDVYCKMMSIGEVCIVSMSNFCAVNLASFLADGYKDFETAGKYSDNSYEAVNSDTEILLDLLVQSANKSKKAFLEEFLIADSLGSAPSLS